jgi:ethanolamine ammonia-lyase small subunit
MTRTLPDHPLHWDAGDLPAHAPVPPPDPWSALRRHTPARISLGRAGTSLPSAEVLRFAAAHASARDAVHLPLDVDELLADLRVQGLDVVRVASRAASRAEYLARPDLGRQLAPASRDALEHDVDEGLCIVIGDGLSAIAAQTHAVPLVSGLRAAGIDVGRVVVATQARVALGDEIGERVGASLVLMLLGERPGLSSPDSLGAYLTWAPAVGRVDSERNCVSNIRPEGLPLADAAARIAWLVREAQRRRVSGIALKDDSEVPAVAGGAPALPAT